MLAFPRRVSLSYGGGEVLDLHNNYRKGKEMSRTTVEEMKKEIRTALSNGEDMDDIKDRSGEWVDGYLPVYANQIIREWQEMPSEYNERGYNELGMGGEITIIGLMGLDLYIYYTDLFNEAVEELEEELAEQEEEVNA
jgi:hypothetical protein